MPGLYRNQPLVAEVFELQEAAPAQRSIRVPNSTTVISDNYFCLSGQKKT